MTKQEYEWNHHTGHKIVAKKRKPKKRKKKYTWASFWAIAKYPIYLLIAIATTGYLVGGSWIWYILLTK